MDGYKFIFAIIQLIDGLMDAYNHICYYTDCNHYNHPFITPSGAPAGVVWCLDLIEAVLGPLCGHLGPLLRSLLRCRAGHLAL